MEAWDYATISSHEKKNLAWIVVGKDFVNVNLKGSKICVKCKNSKLILKSSWLTNQAPDFWMHDVGNAGRYKKWQSWEMKAIQCSQHSAVTP